MYCYDKRQHAVSQARGRKLCDRTNSGSLTTGVRGGRFRLPRILSFVLLSLFTVSLAGGGGGAGGGAGAETLRANADSREAWSEDHAVVAVTVEGQVYTLDAWTGHVRGVLMDSGGPLVSSSTTVDSNVADNEMEDEEIGGNGSDARGKRPSRRRNALKDGFVVPGLDGVIYSLGTDGSFSVLMSSAPDLVSEPRMACLAMSDDLEGGIVEDESCGLLIGDKTTELFSLDTVTGKAKRVGEGSGKHFREDGDKPGGKQQEMWREPTASLGEQPKPSQLLLQREEYVVRALDATTSEMLWFVTVAHFSALDLEARGGSSDIREGPVAATHREHSRSVCDRLGDDARGEGDILEALPLPSSTVEDDQRGVGDFEHDDWLGPAMMEEGVWGYEGRPKTRVGSRGSDPGSVLSVEQQRKLRHRFGEAHANRFPSLVFENQWVVAVDPIDGNVLWRREMPALAVSLFGARGGKWASIRPPPMALLQGSMASEDAMGTVKRVPVLENGFLGEVARYRVPLQPLLLVTDGSETEEAFVSHNEAVHVSNDNSVGDADAVGPTRTLVPSDDFYLDATGDGATSLEGMPPARQATSIYDLWLEEEADPAETALVPSVSRRNDALKVPGLLQSGLRQGQLHAQLGFLNRHFYVSSVLKRGPLHVSAEEGNGGAGQDRYSHPAAIASRRPFVDATRRDMRSEVVMALLDDLSPLPSPVAKITRRTSLSADQSGIGLTTRIRVGQSDASVRWEEGMSDVVAGRSGVEEGGEHGGLRMEMNEWRKALLDRLSRDIHEGTTAAGVEVHPAKKGVYMSWEFIAWMVSLLTVIVTVVAYMAYNYGAEAMVNMSNITRTGSMTVRLNRLNVTPPSVSAGQHDAEVGEEEHVSSGKTAGDAPSHPIPLENGAVESSSVAVTPGWASRARDGKGSPPDMFRGRRRRPFEDVHIQRVRSLPALSDSHSPATPRDRNKPWKTFGAEMRPIIDSALLRSESDDPPATAEAGGNSFGVVGNSTTSRAGEELAGGKEVETRIEGHGGHAEGPPGSRSELLAAPRSSSISSSSSGSPSGSRGTTSTVSSGRTFSDRDSLHDGTDVGSGSRTSSPNQRGGGRRHRRKRNSRERSRERQGSRRIREERHRRLGKSRRSEDSDTGDDSGASGGKADPARDEGDRNRERKRSRSPRAPGVEESLVVHGGRDEPDPIGVETGGKQQYRLLVANRRLRTEFIEGPKLGKGGFGTVFKCRNMLDGHDYAVKKIRLSSDRRWQHQLAKVLREVKILALLDHPNIVRYYQAWLEKFEEDDELLGAQGSLSMADSSDPAWEATTGGGTLTSYLNGGKWATPTHDSVANGHYNGRRGVIKGGASQDIEDKDHDGDSSFIEGGGALRRRNANAGSGRPSKRTNERAGSPTSPSGPRPRQPKRLSEDLSVDGWSVESRNTDDRGGDWHDGSASGGGRPCLRGTRSDRHFRDFDVDEDGYDMCMEDEEVEDASVPGFVFDRGDGEEAANGVWNETEGVEAGAGAGGDGIVAAVVEAGGGDGSEAPDCAEDENRRPSDSTASVSSPAADCAVSCNEASNCVMEGDGGSAFHCTSGVRRSGGATDMCSSCGEGGGSEGAGDDLGEIARGVKDDTLWDEARRPLRKVSNGHHRSGSLAEVLVNVAAAAQAADAAEGGAGSERRPRGESWPQNRPATRAEAKGNPRNQASPAQELRPREPSAFRNDLRRRDWRKGGWERGGRHFPGRGRRTTRPREEEIYDLWLYIQMQYCSHNNLQYFLEENPERLAQTRVDMPQVMHIFLQVVKGLQYVHACGLIHRDLKPANCFLMGDGTVKIGDFGLSRHILPTHGVDAGAKPPTGDASPSEIVQGATRAEQLSWAGGDDAFITGGVGTYLYGSPEQMKGQGYDEKTDMYSLGMLLFEMCHPPFGTKMERTIVLTKAHKLVFPQGDVWGPAKGQEAIKNLCRAMLQEKSCNRPSAAEVVRQVELMQGKHMLLQLEKKPPISYPDDGVARPDVAVVLRVEAVDKEGLLHRLVDLIRSFCRGQEDASREGSGASLDQYGLRGHTGSAVMEFLIAGASLMERETIIAALEDLEEVHSVREFPANS